MVFILGLVRSSWALTIPPHTPASLIRWATALCSPSLMPWRFWGMRREAATTASTSGQMPMYHPILYADLHSPQISICTSLTNSCLPKMMDGKDKVLNTTTVIYTPEPWSHGEKMVAPATRDEVTEVFKDWSPPVRDLIARFPEKLHKWGIFDMAEHPAPTYASGRVAIVGDAAHASTPFLGAGGAMGIEDALAMASAMYLVSQSSLALATSIPAALQAFSAVRLERSQWLVQSSREMGVIFQWRDPSSGNDGEKFRIEAEQRTSKVWDFDVDGMVDQVRAEFEQKAAGPA